MTMAQPTVLIDVSEWRVARDDRGREYMVRAGCECPLRVHLNGAARLKRGARGRRSRAPRPHGATPPPVAPSPACMARVVHGARVRRVSPQS